MTEIIEEGKSNLPSKRNNIDLDTFKSIYYWANAKPDTQIKLFRKRKRVEVSNIHELNERVNNKLANHNISTYMVSLNFMLDEGNLREYASYAEFERENWDLINQKIQSISLTWDLTFEISGFELPQRHTMKVRIGNAIPPKDMFQIMFTSDEPNELMETQAEGLVKVDFINQTLSNELIQLVKEWHEGLKNVENKNVLIQFLYRREGYINNIIGYSLPLFLMFLAYSYQKFVCNKLDYSSELNLINLQSCIIMFFAIFAAGNLISKFINRWYSRKVEKFKSDKGFLISKGDKNYLNELKTDNNKILRSIIIKFCIALIVAIIMVFLKIPLEGLIEK